MKKIFLLVLSMTSSCVYLSAQEKTESFKKPQYYFNASVNFLKLADKFADRALEAYYQQDIDTDYIKELNKIRYQYQLLGAGLNPYKAVTHDELNEIANVYTAIDFDLMVDRVHGKTIMQHIEDKTLNLCQSNPASQECMQAKKTFAAFKQYLLTVFEELKKYDSQD